MPLLRAKYGSLVLSQAESVWLSTAHVATKGQKDAQYLGHLWPCRFTEAIEEPL